MAVTSSILAATDLSAPARHAAERAAQIAQHAGDALTLAHVVNESAFAEIQRWFGTGHPVPQALLDEARERLHALAEDLGARTGLRAHERLRVGRSVDEVMREAEVTGARLIVVGTRGAGLVRSLIVGSTAERIAKRCSRPVLMVRSLPRGAYRRVLVPVDFSPWSVPAVRLALDVAPEALIVLLHAISVPFEGHLRYAGVRDADIASYREDARARARDALRMVAREVGLTDRQWIDVTPYGDPWMKIVEQEQEQDCDLVVIGKHGRNALESLVLGSTTERVIAECTGDVLISTERTGATPTTAA